MYTHGKGVDVDLERAFKLNLSAASDGEHTIHAHLLFAPSFGLAGPLSLDEHARVYVYRLRESPLFGIGLTSRVSPHELHTPTQAWPWASSTLPQTTFSARERRETPSCRDTTLN